MQKIQVRAIIEILGRPPQHIAEGLKMLASKIKNEQGIVITEETHHAPILVKDSKDLYTTFMELSMDINNLNTLFGFLFQYMPANIEIISPEMLELSNQEMNQATNHLAQRMHQYDAITKRMMSERDLAMQKLYELHPELFKQAQQMQAQQQKKESKKPSSKKKSVAKKSRK